MTTDQFNLNLYEYSPDELMAVFRVSLGEPRAKYRDKMTIRLAHAGEQFGQQADITQFFSAACTVLSALYDIQTLSRSHDPRDINDTYRQLLALPRSMTDSDMVDSIMRRRENTSAPPPPATQPAIHDLIQPPLPPPIGPIVPNERNPLPAALNLPIYSVGPGRIDPSLNGRNINGPVFNTVPAEIGPGDLNSLRRIVQLVNVCLNSCFRENYYMSSPTNFLYLLPVELKNVISMRLVSLELPNAWYLFSNARHNNLFRVIVNDTSYDIYIPAGNYTADTLQYFLNTTYFYEASHDDPNSPLQHIRFSIGTSDAHSAFEVTDTAPDNFSFSLSFSLEMSQNIMETCGWILGFRMANYSNITPETPAISEGLFDAGGDRCVYVCVNDFLYNRNTSTIVCYDKSISNEDVLAKIPMHHGKLSLVINDYSGTALAKVRQYNGPVSLSRLQIRLVDHFGNLLDLNSMDFSMTLELQILYENFNFQNITA